METSKISNMTFATCLILLSCNVITVILADDDVIFGAKDPCSSDNAKIYPHPLECQVYFNCSKTDLFQGHWHHVDECKYPDLFSTESLRCESHQDVQCGARKELKDACDYNRNKCFRSHCRPCHVRWPKCNVKDGKTDYKEMKGTSLYGICEDWRVVDRLSCEKGVFDATTKTCKIPTA